MYSLQPLHYTQHEPDRLAHSRKNQQEIKKALELSNTRIIPYWNGLHWLSNKTIKQPDLLSVEAAVFPIKEYKTTFIGKQNEIHFFSVDLSALSEKQALALLPDGRFVDIRQDVTLKRSYQASLLVYTRGLYLWHAKNGFCGVCGNKNRIIDAGHARQCTNCTKVIYPRIDPAVIVLIEYIPEKGEPLCLLAQHRSRQSKMYSTLAGFVETGESLEATVKREMKEEVGLEVTNIRYVASQPWPFPSSLMIGFYAQAKSMDLSLDNNEVHEAQWFSATKISNLVSQNDLILSREDSIARYLIQNWVNKNLNSENKLINSPIPVL